MGEVSDGLDNKVSQVLGISKPKNNENPKKSILQELSFDWELLDPSPSKKPKYERPQGENDLNFEANTSNFFTKITETRENITVDSACQDKKCLKRKVLGIKVKTDPIIIDQNNNEENPKVEVEKVSIINDPNKNIKSNNG